MPGIPYFVIPDLQSLVTFEFVISRSDSDEKSKRSLALLGTWISPRGRNDRKFEMPKNRYHLKVSNDSMDQIISFSTRSLSICQGARMRSAKGLHLPGYFTTSYNFIILSVISIVSS